MKNVTTQQKNIWDLQRYYPRTGISNLCGAIVYHEKRDSRLLELALEETIRANDALRLRFTDDGGCKQYLSTEPVLIENRRFADEAELDRYAHETAVTPVSLQDSAMCSFTIFQMGSRSGILAKMNHLIADAWSFGLIADEVEGIYGRLCREGKPGEHAGLPAESETAEKGPYSYLTYAEEDLQYRESDRYQRDRAYWQNKYLSRPEETRIRLSEGSPVSIESGRIIKELPEFLSSGVGTYCRQHGITEAVLFESAVLIYLARTCRNETGITIGLPVLNRNRLSEKKTVGMFISTMPLTVKAGKDDTLEGLYNKILTAKREMYRHHRFPYEDILQMLRKQHDFQGNLYDVMVSVQNTEIHGTGSFYTKWYDSGYSEVPLTVSFDRRDGQARHTVTMDYQKSVITEEETELLYERIVHILGQMTGKSGTGQLTVADIDVLAAGEKEKLLYTFNDTHVEYPEERCVHELFSEQAKRTPDREALVFEGESFTYRQLDEMSNSLAHYLRSQGIGRGDIVPIIAKRDWRIIVAMLGILKAGGAYMPVSPEYPAERIGSMLGAAECKISLCFHFDNPFPIKSADLERFDFKGFTSGISYINDPDDICYVIFTSGSTGAPKGCPIFHHGFVNTLSWRKRNYQNKMDSVVCVSPFFTDTFEEDVFTALLSGGRLLLVGDNHNLNCIKESAFAAKGKSSIMTTPTFFKSILSAMPEKKWESVILVGEALTEQHRSSFMANTGSLHNEYGPSECSICATYKDVTCPDDPVTIGRPIANTQIYILDGEQQLLPVGVAGELCIAGAGVGKGYLNRPELTAERFIANPYATEENHHGKVLYRTGDLARWRPDGEIEYLGRIDTQVKIRGLRIELGEIESAMSEVEGIGLTAVAAQKDESGRQYLAGYYTAEGEISEKELRKHLSEKLPRYMVPNYFMRIEKMPVTASGKTDRRNLPVPEMRLSEREYTAPETDTEVWLSKQWENKLDTSAVSKTDDFFELGGDSLTAIELAAEIENAFHTTVSISDLFLNPTLEEMAAWIDHINNKPVKRLANLNSDKYRLLPQQKAIYAACKMNPDSLLYNITTKIPIPESVDCWHFANTVKRVVSRQKNLLCHIDDINGELYAIHDPEAVVDISFFDDEEDFIRPFDLHCAPLVRIGITKDALLFDVHHIVCDGASLGIILREISNANNEQRANSAPDLWYGDYAEAMCKADKRSDIEYYRNQLCCDFEPVSLPKSQTNAEGGLSRFYSIGAQTCRAIKSYTGKNGLTDTMLYFGAYVILLSKFTGKKDILTSIILQNRTMPETRNMIGMFVNTLPVYVKVDGSIEPYFKGIREIMLQLFNHQETALLDITDELGMDPGTINTSFVYQAKDIQCIDFEGTKMKSVFIETGTSKFDLTMELTPTGEGLVMRMEFDRTKYGQGLIDRMAFAYISILEQLSALRENDSIPVSRLDALAVGEKEKQLYTFNDTHVEYPEERCVHELFSEQAERTPDREALVFEEKSFTYRQLDEMSNSLAHYLRSQGIGRGDIVPIIARRDWRIIVAMLGILKAGGTYMPVSPEYPAERIHTMIETARSKLVLCYGEREELTITKLNLALFDFQKNSGRLENYNISSDLCYIIFTSGSTGNPKGVSICHRNVVNYCHNNKNNVVSCIIHDNYRKIVSVTNFVFDIFVTESLLPLLNGLTIYFTNEEEAATQRELSQLIVKNNIDILQTTPTKMRSLMLNKENRDYLSRLKAIVLGGEAFPSDLYKEIRNETEADVFNIYGPAETTVWSSNGRVTGATGITIGRPIANTQIYILDGEQQLLPVGVAGELCIAGAGVGKGYLNRPELTAERFIANPYATEENHHGKVLYRTGDLARWRPDGEIEYLGRIDTQVKIRGLRIELGEIESAMSEVEGIGLTAVAAQKDESGRQYLAGYYTAEGEISEKELRKHLSEKLPRYMVPNYFMRIEKMPVTASGKTDRRNLPVPEMRLSEREYTAPETEMEKLFCSILEDILSIERVGTTDDFFEIGGDSLGAITFVSKAHDLGIEIRIQDVYEYPTVLSLTGYLQEESGEGHKKDSSRKEWGRPLNKGDFEKYTKILSGNRKDHRDGFERRDLGNILLTGATGFLGAHILSALMKEETGKVYCLMREKGGQTKGQRLTQTLEWYFGDEYRDMVGRRIIAVSGDIDQEGLSEELPEGIGTVIHAAAIVKHYGPYSEFRKANVAGTGNVAAFAERTGAELIHISTASVSGRAMEETDRTGDPEEGHCFGETDLYIGQNLDNVYIRSKFEAERLVMDRMLTGRLKAKIVRVGNLTNRVRDYRFQPNYTTNAFLRRMKAILELGKFPDSLLGMSTEFSPVDLTAEGIVNIAQYGGDYTVFHLYNNKPLRNDRMLQIMSDEGIGIEAVPEEEFIMAAEKTLHEEGRAYIYESLQDELCRDGVMPYGSRIHAVNDFSVWFLEKCGFVWDDIDENYLKGYINYYRKIGYLNV